MSPSALRHPAIDAALATAATLTGMEVVFIAGFMGDEFSFDRVRGDYPGLTEGMTGQRTDSLCSRMLSGAPNTTADAARDPAYADAPFRSRLAICSYVGVPIRDAEGNVLGTLCGIDRSHVEVSDEAVGVLRELAEIVAAHLSEVAADDGVVIRRTPGGWQIGTTLSDDLTSAMVLADLLRDDLEPATRPERPDHDLDEIAKLRLAITQLEHALAARVVVEQAIGVLSERRGTAPRDSFEMLRRVARRGGQRVHDLSREIVRSATEPVTLPDELGPR